MLIKKEFGERLHALRKESHETQLDLAEAVGTAKSHVSEMEKGKRTTTLERFVLICEHYKVSADYLLGLTSDPEPYPPAK